MTNEPPSDSARVTIVVEHARGVVDAAFVEVVTGDPRPRVDAIDALRLALRSLDRAADG